MPRHRPSLGSSQRLASADRDERPGVEEPRRSPANTPAIQPSPNSTTQIAPAAIAGRRVLSSSVSVSSTTACAGEEADRQRAARGGS